MSTASIIIGLLFAFASGAVAGWGIAQMGVLPW